MGASFSGITLGGCNPLAPASSEAGGCNFMLRVRNDVPSRNVRRVHVGAWSREPTGASLSCGLCDGLRSSGGPCSGRVVDTMCEMCDVCSVIMPHKNSRVVSNADCWVHFVSIHTVVTQVRDRSLGPLGAVGTLSEISVC